MIGEILDGKYRIDRQLGAGGMGNVYLSTHLGTTRVVAVKLIAPKWAADPQFLVRFQREAQVCGRLRHPNIVNVTDFGIAPSPKGHIPYLVMELLDGQTLAAFQESRQRAPLTLVADLLDQVALALEEAHRNGIVHRDLKPENIWLEPDGRGGYIVKVLDFGVAKMKFSGEIQSPVVPVSTSVAAPPAAAEGETLIMSGEAETLAMPNPSTGPSSGSDPSSGSFESEGGRTMPGSLVGTPAYMSPEQAMGKEIDFRSDIYSLAVVAYSLVCGELPFRGKSASDLVAFHLSGSLTPPVNIVTMPRDVSDAVMAGLARDPAERPPSAVEFARRFHNAVDAEFFALRRSRAFLWRHLGQFALMMIPLYGTLLGALGILNYLYRKLLPWALARTALIAFTAAILLVLFDNLLRAAASLIALDESVRLRRFVSFRVLWRVVKALPRLAATQARSIVTFGPGWLTADCLWPVVAMVENLRGRDAVLRSRRLMTGLKSAGRALAIRHCALAVIAIGDVVTAVTIYGKREGSNDAWWFPIYAVFAAAPLYLYDRTAARDEGPLLRLDRTPEVRLTTRALSLSSLIWLIVGAIYLLYGPIKLWLARVR